MRWLDGITVLVDMSLSKLQEVVRTGKLGVLQSMGCRVGRGLATEKQQATLIRVLHKEPGGSSWEPARYLLRKLVISFGSTNNKQVNKSLQSKEY